MYELSNFFSSSEVKTQGKFSQLDAMDSLYIGSLAYCQNLQFLNIASKNKNISSIIVTPELANENIKDKGIVISLNPRTTFFNLYNQFNFYENIKSNLKFGIGENCNIHPSAIISKSSFIGDRVTIGPGTVIEDNSFIHDDTYIGQNVVIGAQGLVTLRDEVGRLKIIKHKGSVEIGKRCEILAGTIIAKSLFQSPTFIDEDCQIGILTTIGHGAFVDKQTVIAGNIVVAGRAKIGENVWIGAGSSIAHGIVIGKNAKIQIGSVVVSNVGDKETVSGNFAIPHAKNVKNFLRGKS